MIFSHVGAAGLGINGVHLEILVRKTAQGPVAACCAGGECIGDFEEASCVFQGGEWILGASCGADPDLPLPICAQAECSFTNGSPLDDLGAPVSQFAPDRPFGAGAADDFILTAPGDNPCRISQVRAWMTHTEAGIMHTYSRALALRLPLVARVAPWMVCHRTNCLQGISPRSVWGMDLALTPKWTYPVGKLSTSLPCANTICIA